jgi:aminoglycoside 6'-N-acetyltransferase
MRELRGSIVRLRLADRVDIPRLAEIRGIPEVVRHWRGGDDPRGKVEEELADADSTGYVIELDGRVVGWIQSQEETDPDYRSASMDIYVDPAVHGRGVGTDAIRTLAQHLIEERGHHHLFIDPAADNAVAIRCYEKAGFRPVGIMRRNERGEDGTWHDALLMDLLADELTR